MDKLLDLHREIANWYRLLMEATVFYGTNVQETDVFFTGMSVPLVFNTYNPEFWCPISTTTSYQIAHNFSKGRGLILKMKPVRGASDYYFDVEWFSQFPSEKERLFGEASTLQIADLSYFIGRNVVMVKKYIEALE